MFTFWPRICYCLRFLTFFSLFCIFLIRFNTLWHSSSSILRERIRFFISDLSLRSQTILFNQTIFIRFLLNKFCGLNPLRFHRPPKIYSGALSSAPPSLHVSFCVSSRVLFLLLNSLVDSLAEPQSSSNQRSGAHRKSEQFRWTRRTNRSLMRCNGFPSVPSIRQKRWWYSMNEVLAAYATKQMVLLYNAGRSLQRDSLFSYSLPPDLNSARRSEERR